MNGWGFFGSKGLGTERPSRVVPLDFSPAFVLVLFLGNSNSKLPLFNRMEAKPGAPLCRGERGKSDSRGHREDSDYLVARGRAESARI